MSPKPNAKIEEHIKHIRDHCDENFTYLLKRNILELELRELAKDRLLKLKIVDNDKVLIRYITKHSKNACK